MVWGDVTPPSNDPGEGENCNGNAQATYSITGTYSQTLQTTASRVLHFRSAIPHPQPNLPCALNPCLLV